LIDTFTQEQQWGWGYWLQEHHKSIDEQNEAIDEANSLLPEGSTPQQHITKPTMEQYVALRLAMIGDEGYKVILRIKEQRALQMFYSLPPEQQDALIEQFQIPPVLQS
jgi:hypothetical protein